MFKIIRGERNFSSGTPFHHILLNFIDFYGQVFRVKKVSLFFFAQEHSPLLNNNTTDHTYSEVSYPMPQILVLSKRGLLTFITKNKSSTLTRELD